MTASTRGARRTRLEADDRREQIVSAAQRLFATRPYESVSTGDIAAAAGTTRTNIHHHFGTKRDLFLEIIERFARVPVDLAPPTGTADVQTAVSHVLGRWLDLVEANAETFMTMLHASSSQDPQVSGVLTTSMSAWEQRLTVIVGLSPDSASDRARVRAFQAMVSAAASEWLEHGNLTKEDVHELLTNTLVHVGPLSS